MIKMISAVVALSPLFVAVPAAHAATDTFDNNKFSVSYVFGPSGTVTPLQTETVTGNTSTAELADFWSWQVDTAGNTLSLTWNKQSEFMNTSSIAPFIGFHISDTQNQLSDILGVSIANTAYIPATLGNLIDGFGPANLTFDADNIYINLNESMWHDLMPVPGQMGDAFRDKISLAVNFQAAPIPEPETYAMLLAGLGLMGTVIRRRKSRKDSK
ncbi:MAG: PEP-CTERM sorting domain-containing protein [Nitrosospira sp.]